MLSAYSLKEIRDALAEGFERQQQGGRPASVRMTGILLCPPGAAVAKDEILPRLDDFHHRSGDNIDFFCPGYGAYWPEAWVPDVEVVAKTTDRAWGHVTNWQYSAKYFSDFLYELKIEAPKWQYSEEVDLLLLNAHSTTDSSATLDFSSGVSLRLSQMRRDAIIGSIPELFGKIFLYAKEQDGHDPTWGFSDRMGLSIGRSWFVDLVLSLLPQKTGDLWKRGKHYAHVQLA